MRRRTLLAGGLALPAIAQAGPTRRLRYASVGGATDAAIFLAMDDGIFAAHGIDLEYQQLQNAATLITATATGQVDVAGISLTPGLLASIGRGINLRVVGDKESIRAHFAATQLVVRSALAGGDMRAQLDRLRGHRVAISGRASASFVLLGLTAAHYGIPLDHFDIIELGYANMIIAFANGAIDAAIMLEPYLSRLLLSGSFTAISDFTDIVPAHGGSIVPIVYAESLATNQELGRAFMLAYMTSVRRYNDAIISGTGREHMFEVIARHTGMDIDVVRATTPSGYDPNQFVSPEFFTTVEQFFLAQKLLRAPIDISKLLDASFADHAIMKLGRAV